ncbi:MAG: hypothetical protein ACFCUX_04890 [Candidatus Methylacidiphilales bacterium]
MSEIVTFLQKGASRVTPAQVDRMLRELPLLKAEFAQIDDPKFPHLVEQLNFLAEYVEDFAEKKLPHVSYCSITEAVFALIYAHRVIDLIPDSVEEFGHLDDSVVTRAALIRHENEFRAYAESRGLDWAQITIQP